jgi:hypothetical protein
MTTPEQQSHLLSAVATNMLPAFTASENNVLGNELAKEIKANNYEEVMYLLCSSGLWLQERGLLQHIPDGVWQSSLGTLSVQGGLMHGKQVRYNKMCDVNFRVVKIYRELEMNYDNGKLHGPCLFMRENGSYWLDHWENGVRQGKMQFRLADGTVQHEMNYLDGRLHGDYMQTRRDGTQLLQEYSHGKLVSTNEPWNWYA